MRMKQLVWACVFISTVVTGLQLDAANVTWGSFVCNIEEHGLGGETHYLIKRDMGGATTAPHLSLDNKVGSSKEFVPYENMSSSMWIVAEVGEVINAEAILQSTEFLFKSASYGQSTVDYSLFVDCDAPSYIVFYDEAFLVDLTTTETMQAFGWVEIINDNGNIAVGSSAYMLAGGSLYVGGGEAIPEPTSGLLLLLGVAGLTLRRKRAWLQGREYEHVS